jgi:hypothetical protein
MPQAKVQVSQCSLSRGSMPIDLFMGQQRAAGGWLDTRVPQRHAASKIAIYWQVVTLTDLLQYTQAWLTLRLFFGLCFLAPSSRRLPSSEDFPFLSILTGGKRMLRSSSPTPYCVSIGLFAVTQAACYAKDGLVWSKAPETRCSLWLSTVRPCWSAATTVTASLPVQKPLRVSIYTTRGSAGMRKSFVLEKYVRRGVQRQCWARACLHADSIEVARV